MTSQQNRFLSFSLRAIPIAITTLCLTTLALASPPLSDVIKRDDPERYFVRINGQLATVDRRDTRRPIRYDGFKLEKTPLYFPVILDGGYNEIDKRDLKGTIHLDGIENPETTRFSISPTSSLETSYAQWTIDEFEGASIGYQLEQITTAYSAEVDENRALKIEWPKQWPPEVQDALQPQLYIESTNESVVKAVEKLTQGNPKAVPPYILAKEIARWTVNNFQPTGKNTSNDRQVQMDGLEVKGAAHAVKNGRGPMLDAVCLFVAACRASGLPARPVIGLDTSENDRLNAWAEFFLPTAGWVSVDLRELFSAPGRMQKNEIAWPGFGTNDELNLLVPISHHFHLPGTIAAGTKGKPLLWGWRPQPVVSVAEQRLRFTVMTAPNSGEHQKK